MRTIAAILLLATVAFAQDIDWDNVRTSDVYPAGYEHIMTFTPGQRIVGGQSAKLGQFPYQVGLILDVPGGQSFCGGSLIGPRTVLTAAHCVDSATSVTVYLGSIEIRKDESSRQTMRVPRSNFVIHSGWNRNTLKDDIAIIRLPEEARLNSNVKVIKLVPDVDAKKTFVNAAVVASGWGRPSDASNSISEILRFANLRVISEASCKTFFGSSVRDTNICTDGKDRKSTCNGDSGGPLAYGSGDNRIIIGLTSYGSASGCEKGYAAVFTRVGSYLTWIRQNMYSKKLCLLLSLTRKYMLH